MKKRNIYIALIVIQISSFQLYSQNKRIIKSNLNLLAEEFKDSLNFNGNLFLAKNKEILLNTSYGYSNFEHTIQNNEETVFRIASISKMFTSYAIYILASQNKLSLEDTAVKYIPELDSKFSELTLNNLLNHRSGLTRSIDNYLMNAPHSTYNKQEIIEAISKTDLGFKPGEDFQYSNVGYILLGVIIERVMNQNFGLAMDELIFRPLKMNRTSHEGEGYLIPNKAYGYNLLEGVTLNAEHENKSHVTGAGSISSSINDLCSFAQEIMNGSLLTGEFYQKYISKNKNFRTNSGLITWNYSAKLPSEKKDGQIVMHSGLSPGFSSTLTIYLDHKLVVIGLSNRNPTDISLVYNKFGNVALGFDKELVRKPTVQILNQSIIKGKLKEALKRYKNIIKKDSSLKIKPSELNSLGYHYLQYKQNEKAINMFTFYAMLYPKNSNAYDSLGEAYNLDQNKKQAINAYKKSLELNPKNINARKILKNLLDSKNSN